MRAQAPLRLQRSRARLLLLGALAAALAGEVVLSGCAGHPPAQAPGPVGPGGSAAEVAATPDSLGPGGPGVAVEAGPGAIPGSAAPSTGGESPEAPAAASPQAAGAQRAEGVAEPSIESTARALGEHPEEPWLVDGEQLSGQMNGPLEIDHVRIRHAGLLILADRGRIDPETRRAELLGNVVIRDSVREMSGERAFYYREQALLEMDGHVRGAGPEGSFQSEHLRYDRRAEELRLSGSVRLEEPGRSLAATWLHYDIQDSLITAGGPLQVVETADSVEVLGDLLHYDRRTGRATVVSAGARRPRLTRYFREGQPFQVEADTLELWTGTRRGESRGAVEFHRGAVHGTSRSVIFHMEQNRVLLLGDPRVDDPDGWVAGDSMAVDLEQGRADRLVVWPRARAEYYPPGRVGEAHFAVGDTLSAVLEQEAIRTVVVSGNAQSLYLPSRPDRDQGVGLNWTRARRLRLILEAGAVQRVQFEGETQGRYALPRPRAQRAAAESLSAGVQASGGAADSLTEVVPEPGGAAEGGPPGPAGLSGSLLAAIRRLADARDLAPPDSLLAAEGFDPAETVSYSGERIDFEVATELMTITDQGHVTYHGMDLTAQQIVLDSARDLVRARGDPVLKDASSEVRGEEMTYRIDIRKGLVFRGRSEFEGGYYRGERVKRIDEKTYFGQDVDFTSCEQEESHYHFHAKRMRITPGEKALGGPVVLYISNVPILAIPYAIFPIRSGRHSGLLIPNFEFGFDSRRGRFLRNIGYYLAPSDYWDTVTWFDYVESTPSITLWNRTRYQVRYVLSGSFQGSYARENRESGRRDRWSLNASHDQTLGERFSLKLSASFLSDKSYYEDQEFGASVDERLNRQLRSSLGLTKSWAGASLSLRADRTENLDRSSGATRISQTAPGLNFNVNSFPLGEKPNERGLGGRWPLLASTYLGISHHFSAVYSKPWDGSSTDNQAADVAVQLSNRGARLLGAINLSPSASATAAWAARDRQGKSGALGANWRAGMSASTTLYGTFFPRLGPLDGVRHVADLSASYSFSPENKSVKDFPSVGGIGLSSSKASSVSLSMTHRLHLKLTSAEKVRKIENVINWNASTSYNFLARAGTFPWSSMSHSVQLKPGGPFSSTLNLTHDLETWTRSRLSVNSHLSFSAGGGGAAAREVLREAETGNFGSTGAIAIGPETLPAAGESTGPWSLSLTHTFSVGKEWRTRTSTLNASAGLSPTRRWNLRWSVYFDLTEGEVTSQQYTLTRDLHCWHLSFTHTLRGGDTSYHLLINVKDLPDLKYERRRD